MNAGGHGSDMAATLTDVDLCHLDGGGLGIRRVPVDELGFGYRRSLVATSDLVVRARFTLRPGDRDASEADLAEIVRWRRAHQPGGANCGSVFTNPPGQSAGLLIDQAGLRGHRHGGAHVSPKHANFIQADAGASALDVWALIVDVRALVHDRFGIWLHPEVRTAGFDPVLEPRPHDMAVSSAGTADETSRHVEPKDDQPSETRRSRS